jgi:hypothetical protein
MNESQTSFPSATEAVPTAPQSATDEAATAARETQSSPAPPSSKALETFTAVKHTIKARTHLSDAAAGFVAKFWGVGDSGQRKSVGG